MAFARTGARHCRLGRTRRAMGCGFLLLALARSVTGQSPTITIQPQDQTVCPGGVVTFIVQANGLQPLDFQWRRDGTNIYAGVTSSANDSMLTVNNVQPFDAASVFDVVVTNVFGQANSAGVVARAPDPGLLQEPLDTVVPSGEAIIFHVNICGLEPLYYQWFFNDAELPNTGRISGADSNTLVILNATASDAGSYQVLVHNPVGAIYSAVAQCIVAVRPAIVLQPQSQQTCEGGTATFQVAATGSLPLSFQWHHDGTDVVANVVSYSTNSFLTVTNVSFDPLGFDVTVTNAFGQINSDPAFLEFLHPAFSLHPANTVVPIGATLRLEARACGDPRQFLYQWFKGTNPLTNGGRITGATSNLLTIANAQTNDTDTYKLVIGDFGGNSATSALARCFVGAPPSVGSLTSRVVRFRTQTIFNPTYSGTPPLSYQWYRNDAPIPLATGPSLTRPAVRRPDVGLYHVVVANGAGTATSEKAHLQVRLTLEGNSPVYYEEATDELPSLTNAVPSLFTPPATTVFHGVPLLFSTYNATAQAGEQARCGVIPSHSMWVLYRAPRTEWTKVSTEGSTFDTVAAVYAWDKNTNHLPGLVLCNDNGGADGRTSRLVFSATRMVDYYVAVDGVNGATGIVRLQIGDNIRKAQFNPANGSFRFEWAGSFWKNNILQDTTDLVPPINWFTRNYMPATNLDWIIGYTNGSALSDLRRFYSTTVAPIIP